MLPNPNTSTQRQQVNFQHGPFVVILIHSLAFRGCIQQF